MIECSSYLSRQLLASLASFLQQLEVCKVIFHTLLLAGFQQILAKEEQWQEIERRGENEAFFIFCGIWWLWAPGAILTDLTRNVQFISKTIANLNIPKHISGDFSSTGGIHVPGFLLSSSQSSYSISASQSAEGLALVFSPGLEREP